MSAALEAREVEQVDLDALDQVERWRYDGFLAVGFNEGQAYTLAFTRDDGLGGIGFWLRADDVRRRLLDRGCDHLTAFHLLTWPSDREPETLVIEDET